MTEESPKYICKDSSQITWVLNRRSRDLIFFAIEQLQDEYFEETLMQRLHGEFLLDAYNFDQLPRYFFGLELHKLKEICSRMNQINRKSNKFMKKKFMNKNSEDIIITEEQFIASLISVLDVNAENFIYIVNGAREMYQQLKNNYDGVHINFKDFINLYINSQTDQEIDAQNQEYNKDKDYIINQQELCDNNINSEQIKKLQYSGTHLVVLHENSNSIKLFEPKNAKYEKSFVPNNDNHQNGIIINDCFLWNESHLLAAVYQDSTIGVWETYNSKEQTILCDQLQIRIFCLKQSNIWLTLSVHNQLFEWDMIMKKLIRPIDLGIKAKIIDIIEVTERKLVGVLSFSKKITFYNPTLKEKFLEIDGQMNFTQFRFQSDMNRFLTLSNDNTVVIYKMDRINNDVTKQHVLRISSTNRHIIALEVFSSIDIFITIDEEGSLKSWNLSTLKFMQKVQLQLKIYEGVHIIKLSEKRFIVQAMRLKIFQFSFQSKILYLESHPLKEVYYDSEKEQVYIGNNFQIKSLNINNASIIENYNQDSSNIKKIKGFIIDPQSKKPFALEVDNKFQQVLYKEKNIQGKVLSTQLGNDVKEIKHVQRKNELIFVQKNKFNIYQIDKNQDIIAMRGCELGLSKFDENIIFLSTQMKSYESSNFNSQEIHHFLTTILRDAEISNLIEKAEQNLICLHLNIGCIIFLNYTTLRVINTYYICTIDYFNQYDDINFDYYRNKYSTSLIQKDYTVREFIEQNLIKIQQSFSQSGTITSFNIHMIDQFGLLIFVEEQNLYILEIFIYSDVIQKKIIKYSKTVDLKIKQRVDLQIYNNFKLPVKDIFIYQNASTFKLLIYNTLGQSIQLQSVDDFQEQIQSDYEKSLIMNDKDPLERKHNLHISGQQTLNPEAIIYSLKLGLKTSSTENLFQTNEQQNILQLHTSDIISIVQLNFEESLIFTQSINSIKLWNNNWETLGVIDLKNFTKEFWNVSILNKTKKTKALKKTKDILLKLKNHIQNTISINQHQSLQFEDIYGNVSTKYILNHRNQFLNIPDIRGEVQFDHHELQSHISNIGDALLYKKNRRQRELIDEPISSIKKILPKPTVKDTSRIDQLNKRLNEIYGEKDIENNSVESSLVAEIKEHKTKNIFKIKSIKNNLSSINVSGIYSKRYPDMIDYLNNKYLSIKLSETGDSCESMLQSMQPSVELSNQIQEIRNRYGSSPKQHEIIRKSLIGGLKSNLKHISRSGMVYSVATNFDNDTTILTKQVQTPQQNKIEYNQKAKILIASNRSGISQSKSSLSNIPDKAILEIRKKKMEASHMETYIRNAQSMLVFLEQQNKKLNI